MNAVEVKAFIKRHLARFTIGFWIWLAGTYVLALSVCILCLKIFFSGHALSHQALESGQRIDIIIATSEVEGNARHTAHAANKPVPVATPSTNPFEAPTVNKEGLAPAPLATIADPSDKGLLPIIGSDGTIPWKYYARPYTVQEKRPLVAVILTNLGLSKPLTEDVLKLPHGLTLSFSPYAADAKVWAKEARDAGFESLVDLPMEGRDYFNSDPGPYGLLDNLTAQESSARLRWVLSRFPGFVGVLGPAGEKLTLNPTVLYPTLVELAARGILFLYVKTPDNAAMNELAQSRKLYTLGVDEVLDDEISQDAIEKQLQNLVELAKKQGTAIAIAHSYPPTTDALQVWADTLAAQGVDLVPVSAIAKRTLP